MRLILSMILLASAAIPASAKDAPRFRPATEAEIRQNLRGASQLTENKNGFSYRSGGKTGYKISNGRVCVKYQSGKTDCVRMVSNGSRLQIIDSRGDRDWLK